MTPSLAKSEPPADAQIDIDTMHEVSPVSEDALQSEEHELPLTETEEPEPEQPVDSSLPLSVMLQSSDPLVIEKYIRIEKVKAATKSRAGDRVGARESLLAYKELEKRLEELKISGPSKSLSAHQALLKQRIQQYKQAALKFKRAANVEKAREMLMMVKRMEAWEQNEEVVEPSQLPPLPPDVSDVSAPEQTVFEQRRVSVPAVAQVVDQRRSKSVPIQPVSSF
jgi:hypothetical protein